MLLAGKLASSGSDLFLTSNETADRKRNYVLSVSTPSLGQIFRWVDNNIVADIDLSTV